MMTNESEPYSKFLILSVNGQMKNATKAEDTGEHPYVQVFLELSSGCCTYNVPP